MCAQLAGLVSHLGRIWSHEGAWHQSSRSVVPILRAKGRLFFLFNSYSDSAKSLNARSILGMRTIGRGHRSLESFCGMMDMLPPVTQTAFSTHNQALGDASKMMALQNMLDASKHLHALHGEDPDVVIDIAVTCDGTWSKRGFTATHGLVVIIAWESGQVIDYEILTKHCDTGEPFSAAAFDEWFEEHEAEGRCERNHDRSSPAMEARGAVGIWQRSVDTRHLRYTEMILDGDSKTLSVLNTAKPCSEACGKQGEGGEGGLSEGQGSVQEEGEGVG